MDTLFVAAAGVVGAAVGGVLDPVAQQLAERSRAIEERHRAERAARRADRAADATAATVGTDASTAPGAPVAVPELAPEPVPQDVPEAVPTARHLLPSGRSPGRTVGAALVTGAMWAAVAHHFGPHVLVTPYLVFVALAVAVSVTDLSHRLVPRTLIYGALALIAPLLVVVSAVNHTWTDLETAAVWGAVAFAVFFLIWFLVPKGMGFGDVRLAGVIGLTLGYLGPVHVYLAFLVGFVFGLLFGLVLMVGSSAGRKTRIPFAPALCAGATIAILWGGTIGQHLFHTGS
ncbi:MAG TPA: A24 family peptidase [Acidimicrobiales bacterium]